MKHVHPLLAAVNWFVGGIIKPKISSDFIFLIREIFILQVDIILKNFKQSLFQDFQVRSPILRRSEERRVGKEC